MGKSLNKKNRVVVAMSGGVDSSVVAYLLKKQGFDVIGIFLKFWQPSYDITDETNPILLSSVRTSEGRPQCYAVKKERENACCNLESLAMARQIAGRLDIPFYVIHVESYFKKEIVDNFISEYERGLTPNPCVRCNKYIKFGYLWDKAKALGADYLATGHYVQASQINSRKNNTQCSIHNIQPISNSQYPVKTKLGIKGLGVDLESEVVTRGNPGGPTSDKLTCICRSKDAIKDQTYFLSGIEPSIIPHLLFPLGGMEKSQVRAIAKKAKILSHGKKDSMGICFVPDGDNANFLSKYSKKLVRSGKIVDKEGNVLGKHKGLIGYTIGQKVGESEVTAEYAKMINKKLQISSKTQNPNDKKPDVPRLYVIGVDVKKNRLIVGENRDCFSDTLTVKDLNIIDPRFWDLVEKKKTIYAQIRGGHKAEKCKIERLDNKKNKAEEVIVRFDSPVRAITPGQTVALYDGKVLLGGGLIA